MKTKRLYLLSILCLSILFLFTGCGKVSVNTTVKVPIQNEIYLKAKVVDISEAMEDIYGDTFSFTIEFTNTMPLNNANIGIKINQFDVYVEKYTIFRIQMFEGTNSNYSITHFSIASQTTKTIVLKIKTNKTSIKSITDNKLKLSLNNKILYSNY